MTLLLNEANVRTLLTVDVAIAAVEESLRRQALRQAVLHTRRRLEVSEKSFLHYMAAADTVSGYMGMKVYTHVGGALRFLVTLYSTRSGDLLALLEADYLGQMRTGAASAVATKHMSRGNASTIGIVGTGLQARTQLLAIAAVRRIEQVRAFGRNLERRVAFCAQMSERLGVPVRPADAAEQAVRGADIVVTATTSSRPVLLGQWLAEGVHVNAIGANFAQKRELDGEAVLRAKRIVVDSVEQSLLEAGDLIHVLGADAARWSEVKELGDIVTGSSPGRESPGELTLFKSNGVATWDVAVAARVYELARQHGTGLEIPLWENWKGSRS